LACESCVTFQQQGHSFCGVCGSAVGGVNYEATQTPMNSPEDAVIDEDLHAWVEQGWTVQTSRSCLKCGNPQTCSRVEVIEEEKGHNPGTTLSCNPLVMLVALLVHGLIKLVYPPRIETKHVDRIVCPRCKDEQYESSRIVSERRI